MLFLVAAAALTAAPVSETAATPAEKAEPLAGPFERPFAFASYGTAWAGSYGGAGVGGRIRWEAFRYLGLDLFGETLLVQNPTGIRHDHPIGFNLYVPLRLTEKLRVRPLVGMCAVVSFIQPTEPGAPRADDILLGIHAGLGAEYALWRFFSLFLDVKGVGWTGHDRSVGGWTGSVANEVKGFVVGQANLGIAVHFGPGK